MSFSFSFQVANREEALRRADEEMAKVIAQQPAHAEDAPEVVYTIQRYLDLLPSDPERDVYVSCGGSLGWAGTFPESHVFTAAGVSVSVALVRKQPEAA